MIRKLILASVACGVLVGGQLCQASDQGVPVALQEPCDIGRAINGSFSGSSKCTLTQWAHDNSKFLTVVLGGLSVGGVLGSMIGPHFIQSKAYQDAYAKIMAIFSFGFLYFSDFTKLPLYAAPGSMDYDIARGSLMAVSALIGATHWFNNVDDEQPYLFLTANAKGAAAALIASFGLSSLQHWAVDGISGFFNLSQEDMQKLIRSKDDLTP